MVRQTIRTHTESRQLRVSSWSSPITLITNKNHQTKNGACATLLILAFIIMLGEHVVSPSALMAEPVLLVSVTQHHAPRNQPCVTFKEKEGKEKKGLNTLTIPVAPKSMFESWSFTFSTCCETACGNSKGTVGSQPVEYCNEGQKDYLHKAMGLHLKSM